MGAGREAEKKAGSVQEEQGRIGREAEKKTLESKKSRIGLKGRQKRQLDSKKSRGGLEGRLRKLLVGMHERRTWPSGTKDWLMYNKMPMRTKVQDMMEWEREVVVQLELDDLLLPRMIERFLPTQLTVSPLAWKKNSLDSQLLLRIFLLKSPRTIFVSVTMTIKAT